MSSRARPKRQDPVHRPVDHTEAMTELVDKDPSKRYVGVANDHITMANYRALGYEVETYRDGGVHTLAGGYHPDWEGRPVEIMDCILMSIDRETWEAQKQAGQESATPLEQKLIKRRGLRDDMRGISPEWMEVRDEIGPEMDSELDNTL